MSATLRSRPILRATYTVISPLYDTLVPLVSSRARSLGIDLLNVKDEERVLDVGCGTGIALRPIAESNPNGETVGLDATPAMSERAQHRLTQSSCRRYRVDTGPATDLPYPTDYFDAVLSTYALDVLPTDAIEPALKELSRVIRPTGRLVLVHLSVPERAPEKTWAFVARYAPLLLGGARPVQLKSSIADAGFSICNSTTRTQLGLKSRVVRAIPT